MSLLAKTIGQGFNVGGFAFPEKTAATLSRLFLTPFPRMKASIWSPELDAVATPSTLTVTGHSLTSWKIGDGDRRVLFCHGWGGCAANGASLMPGLLDAGFEVHTFDGPAHGDGKLRSTNMLEFGEAFGQLTDRYGPFTAAIGHSFGGGALTLALGKGLSVERVALIAPMINSEAATEYFLDQLGIRSSIRPAVHDHLKAKFAEEIDAWDLAHYAKRHTTPALIFHDTGDNRVPYDAATQAAKNWENCTLVTTEGLGHQRILKDQSVIDHVTSFVATGAKPTYQPDRSSTFNY